MRYAFGKVFFFLFLFLHLSVKANLPIFHIAAYEILKQHETEGVTNLYHLILSQENFLKKILNDKNTLDGAMKETLFFSYLNTRIDPLYIQLRDGHTYTLPTLYNSSKIWQMNIGFAKTEEDILLEIARKMEPILVNTKLLMDSSDTGSALFVKGLIQIMEGKKKAGWKSIMEAKKKGYPLAYIYEAQSILPKEENLEDPNYIKKMEEIYQLLLEVNEKKSSSHSIIKQAAKDEIVENSGLDFLLGILALDLKKRSTAIIYLEKNIKKDQVLVKESRAFLGTLYYYKGKFNKSKQHLLAVKDASQIKPLLIELYIKDKEYGKAIKELTEIVTHWGQYGDKPVIASAFWLSYLIAKYEKNTEDNKLDSYLWASRAMNLYEASKLKPHTIHPMTGTYIIPESDFKIGEIKTVSSRHLGTKFPNIEKIPHWSEILALSNLKKQTISSYEEILKTWLTELEKQLTKEQLTKLQSTGDELFILSYSDRKMRNQNPMSFRVPEQGKSVTHCKNTFSKTIH